MEQASTHQPGAPQSAFGMNTTPAADIPVFTEIETPQSTETEVPATDVDAAVQAESTRVEQEARAAGWVPQEEWDGAPDRWRPAADFLEVRETMRKITREENQSLRAKLAALETRERERERRENEARSQITRDSLRLELKQAQEENNWDRVNEITDKILDLKVERIAQPQAPRIDPHVQEAWEGFAGQNRWLMVDNELKANFAVELKAVVDANAARTLEDAMALAKKRVMKLYPEKFRGNGRPSASMAEMGGTPGASGGGRTWADLKPEYRRDAERDIQKGKYTKEQFLANCLNEPNPSEYFQR